METHESQNNDLDFSDSSHNTDNSNDTHSSSPEEKKESLLVRAIVIVGIIVILFFISLAIVRFVPKIFSAIGGVFGGGDLSVSTNSDEVKSSENFVINWENKSDEEENKIGVYTVKFACAENIKIEYESKDGLKPVICNTYFPLPQDATSYPFTATSENTKDTDLNFVVDLWDPETNKEKLSDKAKITVLPESLISKTATTTVSNNDNHGVSGGTSSSIKTATTTKSSENTNNSSQTYSGSPDLAIKMVDVGFVDPFGNYHSSAYIPEGSRVLITFNVQNIGTAPTGAWTLSATLPSKDYSQRNFYSPTEPSVAPGANFNLNLAFDAFDPSAGVLSITLQNSADTNTGNNSASVSVYGGN